MRAKTKIVLMAGTVLLGSSAATASLLELDLSTHSSDETDAGLLDATFAFSEGVGTLSLTVTNNTTAPNAFNLSEIYFNIGDITGFSQDVFPSDWSIVFDVMVDGFGVFDIGVTGDNIFDIPNSISPGSSEVFTFTFDAGSGDIKNDITSSTSTGGYLIAGKFIQGPGDDSAFGATVPTPGALAMLAAAGLLGARRRRR